jgi:hypothetical protein
MGKCIAKRKTRKCDVDFLKKAGANNYKRDSVRDTIANKAFANLCVFAS